MGSSEITFLRYETEFNAEADCIDADGEVIETKKIKGSFSGRTFKTTGKTMIFTTDCVETKCSCSRRRLMDRLGGESEDDFPLISILTIYTLYRRIEIYVLCLFSQLFFCLLIVDLLSRILRAHNISFCLSCR